MNISSLLLNRSLVIDVKGTLLLVKSILAIIQNYVLTFKSPCDSCHKEWCSGVYLSVLGLLQVWKMARWL